MLLPDLVQPLLGMLMVPDWVRQLQLVRQPLVALATWRLWACCW